MMSEQELKAEVTHTERREVSHINERNVDHKESTVVKHSFSVKIKDTDMPDLSAYTLMPEKFGNTEMPDTTDDTEMPKTFENIEMTDTSNEMTDTVEYPEMPKLSGNTNMADISENTDISDTSNNIEMPDSSENTKILDKYEDTEKQVISEDTEIPDVFEKKKQPNTTGNTEMPKTPGNTKDSACSHKELDIMINDVYIDEVSIHTETEVAYPAREELDQLRNEPCAVEGDVHIVYNQTTDIKQTSMKVKNAQTFNRFTDEEQHYKEDNENRNPKEPISSNETESDSTDEAESDLIDEEVRRLEREMKEREEKIARLRKEQEEKNRKGKKKKEKDGKLSKKHTNRHGLVVVCSHSKYKVEGIPLDPREAATTDLDMMKTMWKKYGCEVLCFENKTNDFYEKELFDTVAEKMKNDDISFFAFVLSTHGGEYNESKIGNKPDFQHYFFTFNGQIQTQKFVNDISSNVDIKDKVHVLKMFFIQACSSRVHPPGEEKNNVDVGYDLSAQDLSTLSISQVSQHIHHVGTGITTADAKPMSEEYLNFMEPIEPCAVLVNSIIMFASMSGKTAYSLIRSADQGGWLIKALDEVLGGYQEEDEVHILDVLTDVNRRVGFRETGLQEKYGSVLKAQSCFHHTIIEDFYLKTSKQIQ